MKIYAPVRTANGVYASVRFVDGVGETDNPHLIDWFIKHGYGVEDNLIISTVNDKVETNDDQIKPSNDSEFVEINKLADEPDFESMTPNDLRDWARANGLGGLIKNTRNREKLLEIIRGALNG